VWAINTVNVVENILKTREKLSEEQQPIDHLHVGNYVRVKLKKGIW